MLNHSSQAGLGPAPDIPRIADMAPVGATVPIIGVRRCSQPTQLITDGAGRESFQVCGGGRLGDGKLRRDAVVRLDLDEGQPACAALAEGGGGAVGGEHVGVAVTAEARDGRVRVVPGAGGKLGDPRAHRLIDGQADMLLRPGASYDYIADHRRRQRGGGWGPEKVTGVGGVFLRGGDAAALLAWYAERLGIDVDADYGGTQFDW